MTPTSPFRLAVATLMLALALPGCTRLLEADPLNKTTSIVNGTQVTRGPSRGALASGFATTTPPSGSSFESAVGEPFDVEELGGLSSYDTALPELQGIDFGAEQSGISDIASSGLIPVEDGSAPGSYFLSEIGKTVYFATDQSELTERARDTLRRQAAWLNINTDARVTIEGHADERGTREYNLALGDRRASATRGYLIAVGVDESRIDKTSFGKERPVALGSDISAWSQNRRTETVIEGGGDSFATNPVDTAPIASASYDPGVTTTPLENMVSDIGFGDITYSDQPLISGTSDSMALDPLFPDRGTSALISPPGTINYETTSGLYAPVGSQPVFDATSIAPTVFDTGTIAPSPTPTFTTRTPPTGGGTRIEDVSVDDLLRDPSLIDRIGTPGATTTGG